MNTFSSHAYIYIHVLVCISLYKDCKKGYDEYVLSVSEICCKPEIHLTHDDSYSLLVKCASATVPS